MIAGLNIVLLAALIFFAPIIGMMSDSLTVAKRTGIDFDKLAYLHDRFFLYGFDHDAWLAKNRKVLFSSVDGKKWHKVKLVDVDLHRRGRDYRVECSGTLAYFKDNYYLIGAYEKLYVSQDGETWYPQAISGLSESAHNSLAYACDATVVDGRLFVAGDDGIYSSLNGQQWHKESLVYPDEYLNVPDKKKDKFFVSIAGGKHKLVAVTHWFSSDALRKYVFQLDLKTNQWSYLLLPSPVSQLVRVKNGFFAISGSGLLLLEDNVRVLASLSSDNWFCSGFVYMANKFIATGGAGDFGYSSDGINWHRSRLLPPAGSGDVLACNADICIMGQDSLRSLAIFNLTTNQLMTVKFVKQWR